MPLNVFKPSSSAEDARAFAQIARRALLAEYDRGVVQNALQVIQRSRELLEKTEHLVRPPSQRGDHDG